MRILFVERHAVFVRTVIEESLAALEVTIAQPGRGAASLAAGSFDAALVDFDLDDGAGYTRGAHRLHADRAGRAPRGGRASDVGLGV